MPPLAYALRETPKPVLHVLAQAWEIEAEILEGDEEGLVRALTRAMTNFDRARSVIDGLGDKERSALRMLASERGGYDPGALSPGGKSARAGAVSPGGKLAPASSNEVKMAENKFALLYGKIRALGEDQIKREQPLEQSANAAESLYYRGLLFKGFETVETGARVIVFIADELIDIIEPLTAYRVVHEDDIDDEDEDEDDGYDVAPAAAPPPAAKPAPTEKPRSAPAQAAPHVRAQNARSAEKPRAQADTGEPPPPASEPDPPRTQTQIKVRSAPAEPAHAAPVQAAALRDVELKQSADTSVVDDLTTLLAYISLYEPELTDGSLSDEHMARIAPTLLHTDPARLVFLLELAYGIGMIDVQAGRILAKLAEARVWLGAPRWDQIRRLAEAWRGSTIHVELRHLPGIVPEMIDGYDASAVRGIILGWMRRLLPIGEWWSVGDFVAYLKAESPDYQRPNGDFDVWYIRDAGGQYLNGVAAWDAIDGALLHHTITRPMHWLALIDLGTAQRADSPEAARLTAYGRAFISGGPFPQPAEQTERIQVQPDGTIQVSRKVSRADRLQIARFTSWNPLQGSANAVYSYCLNSQGIQTAAERGIGTPRIAAFLVAALGDTPLPPSVAALLEKWKHGAAAACSIERLLVLRTPSEEMLNLIYDTPALRRYVGARLGSDAAVVLANAVDGLRDALGAQGVQVDWLVD